MPTPKTDIREQYPDSWIAVDPGDFLEGTVMEVRRAWSDARARNNDGWYPLLQVRDKDGNIKSFHAFSAVSYNRVLELRPRPGERIKVTFTGLGKEKLGMNAPKLFSIELPDRDPGQLADSVYDMFDGANTARQSPPVEPDVVVPF